MYNARLGGEPFNMDDAVECSVEHKTIPIHKSISKTAFVAEINTLRMPLFLYSNIDKELVAKIKKEEHVGESKEFVWIDSKGQQKNLTITSTRELPRKFEADVFYALFGLFIRQHAPFDFNYDKKKYDIGVKRVDFTWYQLCTYMNITPCGTNINKLKDSIRIIHAAHYSADYVFYDKENSSYYNQNSKSMTLINNYHFTTKHRCSDGEIDKTSAKKDINYVTFDSFILNNISFEYFKYLDKNMYFNALSSGLSRGLYCYLEANRYKNNNELLPYLKRSFQTLSIGIPIDYKYKSELKRRLNLNLKKLQKIGYLKDWVYSKELGEPDEFIYFCFSVDKEGLKTLLKEKAEKKAQETLPESNDNNVYTYLKMPSDNLVEELTSRGINLTRAQKFVSLAKGAYAYIIKSIIYHDKEIQVKNRTQKDATLLLAFALGATTPFTFDIDIEEYVNNELSKKEEEEKQKHLSIDELYDEYVKNTIEDLKNNSSDVYESLTALLINSLDVQVHNNITMYKKSNMDYSKFEEYLELKTESAWFMEMLSKELRATGLLTSKEEFLQEQLNVTN